MKTRFPIMVAALLFVSILMIPTPTPNTLSAQTEAARSGELAILSLDANILRYDLATNTATAVTTDGDAVTRGYNWPTWSTDGRLAYFGYSTVAGDAYGLAVFVQEQDGTVRRALTSDVDIFTYAYWSPADCLVGVDCRDLALLYTAGNGQLALRNIRDDAGKFSVSEISSGGPHYWDWSPDGQQMFWARYGQELSLYSAQTGEITTILEREQGFGRAVDWSPIDDRLLSAIRGISGTQLAILDGDATTIIDSGFRAGVSAAWSPDGAQIAYLNEQSGTLAVIASAATTAPITLDDTVLAFWWSPDATKLAYIQLIFEGDDGPVAGRVRQTDEASLLWKVYDMDSGTTTIGPDFLPTDSMIYYLNFFDQFSRSHRLWSPDSRFITYGEALPDGRRLVQLFDTSRNRPQAETVREGRIGIFAYE